MQFLGFKELWTSNFSDPMLLLIGFSLLGFSQIFVVNWNLVRDLFVYFFKLFSSFLCFSYSSYFVSTYLQILSFLLNSPSFLNFINYYAS